MSTLKINPAGIQQQAGVVVVGFSVKQKASPYKSRISRSHVCSESEILETKASRKGEERPAGPSGQHRHPSQARGARSRGRDRHRLATHTSNGPHFTKVLGRCRHAFILHLVSVSAKHLVVLSWTCLVPSFLTPRNPLSDRSSSSALTQRVDVSGLFWGKQGKAQSVGLVGTW